MTPFHYSNHEQPINFLQMLQPSATPPYDEFVGRIVGSSDQQASVFLQVSISLLGLHLRNGMLIMSTLS